MGALCSKPQDLAEVQDHRTQMPETRKLKQIEGNPTLS